MNKEQMLALLMTRKGQIVTVKTERPVKVKKNQPAYTKTSEFQCRVGVNYDNIATVKEGRADGTLPAENAGLPWGEWIDFPYTIGHKGDTYIRCTMLNNGFHRAPVFQLDGQVVDKETVKAAALSSEFKEGSDNAVFTIKLSSLLEVK
jgi:hypothetical protein